MFSMQLIRSSLNYFVALPSMLMFALRWFLDFVLPFSIMRFDNFPLESEEGPAVVSRRLAKSPVTLFSGLTLY